MPTKNPVEELVIHTLLAEDSLAESKQAAAYPGNLGAMEMSQFYLVAKPAEQNLMDKLISSNKMREAWELLKKVTGVKLHDPAWLRAAAALGPYEESVIDGLRVVQVNVDGKSKAQIQGNKLLVKWGPDAPPGSSTRTKYLPKWVAWAKKHLTKKDERIEVKKEWARTNIDGFSVYDLEGKEQVAAILTKIRHDVQPILREFGLSFITLNESVAEGSLGFNRGKRIIALNVRQKQNPMALRKYSAIMSTMLHELAHLRHMNHGPQFKLFEAELVAWARDRGIYAPGGRMADLFFTAADLAGSTRKVAKSNAKVVEVPNTFHPVELQDPQAKRKEFPFEGFIDFQGLKIDVENAKGSTRSGTGPEGDWSTSVRRVARRYMTAKGIFEVPLSTSTVKVLPPRKKRKEYPFEGFIDFQGLAIHVENARGSTREGVDPDGTPWKVTMKHHYGEVDQTEGVDHDPVDIYVGPNGDSPLVVVVRQQDPKTKKYDEDKVMVGFDTEDEAIKAYKAQYNSAGFYQSHKSMPIGRFLRWCLDRDNRGTKVSRFNGGSSSGRAG